MEKVEYGPATLFIRTTENCNAGCFMCDYARLKNKPTLDFNQVEKIAEISKEAGIKLIRFTGGEPLLDSRTSSYISYFHREGFKTSIITNGYFLPFTAASLSEAGLDQVIVSLDGDTEELHDRLRNTPKLFRNATRGLKEIKAIKPDIITRVNTVASPYNINRLVSMLPLLSDLKIDQWSIIPLKGQKNLWLSEDLNSIINTYTDFQTSVLNVNRPKLLGYSKEWAGRNNNEIKRYFTTGIPFTPINSCELVKLIRFYIPESDRLTACNCVPWRLRDIDIPIDIQLTGLKDKSLSPLTEYLNKKGPSICKGCEPINAFLGENPSILENDIFAF